MERNTYIPNYEADAAILEYTSMFSDSILDFEEINVDNSLGRVTFEAIYAKVCDPSYNASAMDGIMVLAENTFLASEKNPITLTEHIDFEYINTGGIVTEKFNSVIMIEDVINLENGKIQIISPSYPWQHIRTVGESIVFGEMLLPSKHKIRPIDIGAMVAGGIKTLNVYKVPKVAIIPTGKELIEDPEEIGTGKLMESNSHVFNGLVLEYGGIPNKYPIVRDDYNDLINTINLALKNNDIIVLNAGTSAGTKDYTLKAIEELGDIINHGIGVKPGKPTILGIIKGKPVIGIPGYPVSAFLMFEMFVKPLIYKFSGQEIESKNYIEATLTRRIVSSLKYKEFIRVSLGYVNNKIVATPLDRGAAAIMSLVNTDGILTVPRNVEGIELGETVNVEILKPLDDIKNTLTIIGSHDLIIDVIRDKMKVSSAHVGSLGGITSLKRKECHVAPIHLLDEETGEYNISYILKYFGKGNMALIKGVKRIQGFIVQKGNPKNIVDFNSLKNGGIRFANRQKGAGTRLLFDYNLKLNGINKSDIIGYEKELTTHMAVAINVKSNTADTGLGIYSAAEAMGLDFVPVGGECYDFLIYKEDLNDQRIKKFIEILKSDEFKEQLNKLSGYSYEDIGGIILI